MRRIDDDFPSQMSVRETLEEMRTLFKLGNQLVCHSCKTRMGRQWSRRRLDKSNKLEAKVTKVRERS